MNRKFVSFAFSLKAIDILFYASVFYQTIENWQCNPQAI